LLTACARMLQAIEPERQTITPNSNPSTAVTRSWIVQAPPRDLVVTGPLTISSDSTFNSITVQSGGTLATHGLITVLTNMTVQSGGVLTHAVRDTAGLKLNVARGEVGGM